MIQCLREGVSAHGILPSVALFCAPVHRTGDQREVRERKQSGSSLPKRSQHSSELQATASGRLGKTRGTRKDWLSAIAGLQYTRCSEAAKREDHVARWATASSLQLGRQIMGANGDSRFNIRDGRRADRTEECRSSAIKLPSFAKPADGKVQLGKAQAKVQLQLHLQPIANLESWTGPWKRSSCAANSSPPIC